MPEPQKKPKQDKELSEQEIAQQRDAVIKRMLETPPKPRKDEPKRRKPKAGVRR